MRRSTAPFWQAAAAGVLALALVACGGDSGTGSSSSGGKVGLDTTFGSGGIAMLPLNAGANDRFMAIATAPDGKTYAAGFVTEAGDQAMALARIDASGALDKSFGSNGIATANAAVGGKTAELARAVVVMSDGKIVIAGPAEHAPTAAGDAARDTDIALARFDTTGKLDPTFGKNGIALIDVGTGRVTTGTTLVGDTSWGLGALPGDKLVVFGSKLADGDGRTDADYVILGLTAAGALDSSFGSGGRVIVDLNRSGDSPRNLLVQSDGKLVATGYSSRASDGIVRPVLIRLSAAGVLDKAFGVDGVATAEILPGVTESYQVRQQGDSYIIAGYGRGSDATEKVDLVVERFTANGTWDLTFGDKGIARIDIAKEDDRARNLLVLPDGRILAVGSGKKTADNVDAMLVLLTKDGKPDASFGENGALISNLGGPADAWYGVTLSSDKKHVLLAGYKGTDATSGGNDDSVVARLTI